VKEIILLISAGLVGYGIGSYSTDPEPAWDCYRAVWGDLNEMERRGLEGLTAPQVYDYCRGLPYLQDTAVYLQAPTKAVECPPCICSEETADPPDWFNIEIGDGGCLENGHPEGDD
jgi:hypothetical protein